MIEDQRGVASMVCKLFLTKTLVEVVLLPNQIINLQINFKDKLLEHLREEKFIYLLGTIFGVLI